MNCIAYVIVGTLAVSGLAPSAATAQARNVSDAAMSPPQTHRVRPTLAVGFGFQPQATLDHRLGGRVDEVGGAFTYNIAADIDVMPAIRLGVQAIHTPWEMLHSVSIPAEYPIARGGMTLVSASVAGRLMLGSAVPLWLHVGAGAFRLTQEPHTTNDDPVVTQPALSTVDPAVNMGAYFDFKTRWNTVTVRGGADDTYVFFGEESGLDASHLIAFRLALAYRL